MKIERVKKLEPITITLETQKEIDQLFAILNYSSIAQAIELPHNDWNNLRRELSSCKTSGYERWHKNILNRLE